WVGRFHLRNPRLARADALRKLCLSEVPKTTPDSDSLGKRQLQFHVLGLFLGKTQKLVNGSDRPTGRFKSRLLLALHRMASRSYRCKRRWQFSITRFGVDDVFLLKISRITMASGSDRYMILQVSDSSLIRSSLHRGPIPRIGRACGIPRFSPRCNRRRRNPASILASLENGGVLISPLSHTRGFSPCIAETEIMSFSTYCQAPADTFKTAAY